MGNHELTRETMIKPSCFCCGGQLDPLNEEQVKITGFGSSRTSVYFEIHCPHCRAEYKVNDVKSYFLISQETHYRLMKEDNGKASKAKCGGCGTEFLTAGMLKLADLSYLCHNCIVEKYGKEKKCGCCDRWVREKLLSYAMGKNGETAICPTCYGNYYAHQSCFTCGLYDRDAKVCKLKPAKKIRNPKEENVPECPFYSNQWYGILKTKGIKADWPEDHGW